MNRKEFNEYTSNYFSKINKKPFGSIIEKICKPRSITNKMSGLQKSVFKWMIISSVTDMLKDGIDKSCGLCIEHRFRVKKYVKGESSCFGCLMYEEEDCSCGFNSDYATAYEDMKESLISTDIMLKLLEKIALKEEEKVKE